MAEKRHYQPKEGCHDSSAHLSKGTVLPPINLALLLAFPLYYQIRHLAFIADFLQGRIQVVR